MKTIGHTIKRDLEVGNLVMNLSLYRELWQHLINIANPNEWDKQGFDYCCLYAWACVTKRKF
jgi:hypothetical protein